MLLLLFILLLLLLFKVTTNLAKLRELLRNEINIPERPCMKEEKTRESTTRRIAHTTAHSHNAYIWVKFINRYFIQY